MTNQQKSNSKSNVIKYFLIITASSILLNYISEYFYFYDSNQLSYFLSNWLYYFDHTTISHEILHVLSKVNLIEILPYFIGGYYNSLLVELHYLFEGTLYQLMGEYFMIPIRIIHILIGLAINYGIAFALGKKGVNSAQTSTSVLTVGRIIKNSFIIAQNNIVVILLSSLLWVLTIWIPYLNVGTTIGFYALIVAISKGKEVSATSIFDAKHRKYMGEFFLLLGFRGIGIIMAYIFFIIPGIVITIAWSQAILILIDKKLTPLESIKISNDITYGEKTTIFLGKLSLGLILIIAIILIGFLVAYIKLIPIMILFGFFASITSFIIMTSSSIYIYGKLRSKSTNQ